MNKHVYRKNTFDCIYVIYVTANKSLSADSMVNYYFQARPLFFVFLVETLCRRYFVSSYITPLIWKEISRGEEISNFVNSYNIQRPNAEGDNSNVVSVDQGSLNCKVSTPPIKTSQRHFRLRHLYCN